MNNQNNQTNNNSLGEGVVISPPNSNNVTNTTTAAAAAQPVNTVSNTVVQPQQAAPQVQANQVQTNQAVGTVPNTTNQPVQNNVPVNPTQPVQNNVPVNKTVPNQAQVVPKKPKKKRGKTIFILLLLLIIGGMGYYIYTDHIKDMQIANAECSPVSTSSNESVLDVDSALVQDLYKRVSTNINEDVASTTLDDNMKLYLAYRMIPNSLIYDSNCNLFSDTSMLPYTCQESIAFSPTAFKEETLQNQLKVLFGEKTNIVNQNIQLGTTSCIGGYQYIEARGEYVEGYCEEVPVTTYRVTKELKRAVSQDSIIRLYEDVDYTMSEANRLPESLRDGTYIYTFQLDKNYNYIYVSKALDE